MKKLLLYIILFYCGAAGAQIVNIPDASFKNTLLSASTDNDVARNSDNDPMVIDVNGDNEIQVAEALAVWRLNVAGQGIFSLTGIEAFTSLQQLDCSSNYLSALPLAALVNLEEIECADNNIALLDFTGLINLEELNCAGNPVAELDLSMAPGLFSFSVADCTVLEYLNIKNGSVLGSPATSDITNTPQLAFVCVDEGEAEVLLPFFPGLNMSTYCSFTPGGNYNTISGTITFDADGNGCDAADTPRSFIKVRITDGAETGTTFTNSAGEYSFYTQAGNFTVTPEFEDAAYFTVSPASASVNFPVVDNSVATENFCVQANGIHPDVEVVMEPVVSAEPGLNAVYKIVYKNKGSQAVSGSVSCDWDLDYMQFVSMSPMADFIGPGTYIWNYTNLQPFENREILMTLNINSATDTPAVNPGDILPFTATAGVAGDETPQDNNFVFNQKVADGMAPNNIICIQGDTASPDTIGDYLHYVVNFKNTGSEPAASVVVRHELNETQFDVSTVQVLNSSHEVVATQTGNVIEFVFQNITLDAAGHGNILFKVKTRTNLMSGDHVLNRANVYFGYNEPVTTNDAVTLFGLMGTGGYTTDNSVKIYPNPAKDVIAINAAAVIQYIELYDIQGRLLQTAIVNDTAASLDVSARAAGMYFVKVVTDKGIKAEKIVKE